MEHHKNLSLENIVEEIDGIIYTEEWKDIEGYEGYYQVSSFGRVKSFIKTNKGRIRKGVPADGYLQLQLQINKVFETKKIHRLVAQAFLPNPDSLPEVNHLTGNRKDNRVMKICWSTPSDNTKHAYRCLGRKNNLENQKGESHYNSKFKVDDIVRMRELHKNGYSVKQITEMFGEKRNNNVVRIIKRQRWAHIQ